MVVNLTTVAVGSMMGVLAGFVVNESFGGRRSSIGVHRSDGRLLSFWPGLALFVFVTVCSGLLSTIVAQVFTDVLGGLPALFWAVFGVSMFLNLISYAR